MLGNPIEAFIQAQQGKNRNQQQMYQDIAQMGQGLGEGLGAIGEAVKAQKQKQLLGQLLAAMKQQGAPQQGPQMPPIQGPSGYMPPSISSGTPAGQTPTPLGPPQDNRSTIDALLMQLSPEMGMKAMYDKNDPYKQALTAQANAEAQAKLRPPKPALEYSDYGTSPGGTGLALDKASGKVIDTGVKRSSKGSDSLDFKNTLRQDRLAKEYRDRVQRVVAARTGGLGLQDQKVDQAIHLRSMINQAWNPQTRTYELPEMQQGELVMGLANLVSGSSVTNIEQLKAITPKTARGDAAHLISYWTGKPLTNQPQEMIKNLITSIDRQGQVSEKLRDKYVSGLKNLVPKGLDEDEADNIRNTELTSSFSDVLNQSPDQGGSSIGLTPAEQAELAALDKKYGGRR